jgi:hypothetical protein
MFLNLDKLSFAPFAKRKVALRSIERKMAIPIAA